MPAPAEEHLIKILRVAREVMQERDVEQDSLLPKFVYAELVSGLHRDTHVNMTGKACSLIQMAIDDLEAIQFELEAELGSFQSTEDSWGELTAEDILREGSKR